jgi:hypothetical protein
MAGVLRTSTTATPRAVSASAYESFLRTDVTGASADAIARGDTRQRGGLRG